MKISAPAERSFLKANREIEKTGLFNALVKLALSVAGWMFRSRLIKEIHGDGTNKNERVFVIPLFRGVNIAKVTIRKSLAE